MAADRFDPVFVEPAVRDASVAVHPHAPCRRERLAAARHGGNLIAFEQRDD